MTSLARIRELHAQVLAGKEAIPERDRAIRSIIATKGATRAELADILGCSRENIRQILSKKDGA